MGILLVSVIVLLVLAVVALGWVWLVASPRSPGYIAYKKVDGNRDHRWDAAVRRARERNWNG